MLKKLNDLDYLIQTDRWGTKRVVHHDKLKSYTGSILLRWAKRAVKLANKTATAAR